MNTDCCCHEIVHEANEYLGVLSWANNHENIFVNLWIGMKKKKKYLDDSLHEYFDEYLDDSSDFGKRNLKIDRRLIVWIFNYTIISTNCKENFWEDTEKN